MRKKQIQSAQLDALFHEKLPEIQNIVKMIVTKWNLAGIPYLDRNDVASEILTHVYQKLHLFDQTRPIGNWTNSVCNNFLKNLFRNHFYKYSRPCLNCPAFLGGSSCRIFGEVSTKCDLYAKWDGEKKQQHDVALPLSSEFHGNEINSKPADSLDVEKIISELLPKLKAKLTPNEYFLFTKIHLENVSEKEALAGLKFVNKTTGAAALKMFKNCIVEKVKQIIREEEIF